MDFKIKEINGKFTPPEDNGSEINPEMTVESVKKACEVARDARVKRFNIQKIDEDETKENP